MQIETYGFHPADITEPDSGLPARVTAVYRDRFEIVCDRGAGFARLKTGAYRDSEEPLPTTGDFVLLDWQQGGDSRILKTLPRKTFFSRLDPSSSGRQEQAVAANFDYVFILQSLDRDFNLPRLERYLTLAWQSGATPAVILTKADGILDASAHILAAEKAAIGAEVFAVSAKTGSGLDRLERFLKPGKTVVFLGSSGVGKSTLVNALAGEERMSTGETRERDGRGRHTTSRRQLLLLKSGVMIIDTPGMRELGMWDVSEGLGQSFADVEQYFGKCKFSDCRHRGEPGCAVMDAIRRGELSLQRWERYRKLHAEARFVDDKTGYLREKQRRFKEIAKLQKAMYATDYRHMPCAESFLCKVCGAPVTPENAGSAHRNHCPHCLASIHADSRPGDRASACRGIMDPVAVWVRKSGEWAVIHRCRSCGALRSNRIAADDNAGRLLSMAMRPLQRPLPLWDGASPAKRRRQGSPAGSSSKPCAVCGAPVPGEGGGPPRDHCPRCLTGVHAGQASEGGAGPCGGALAPIAVWVGEDGTWALLQRCRSCGALRSGPVAPDDNAALLLSVAIRPLAAPPFPLWRADGVFASPGR